MVHWAPELRRARRRRAALLALLGLGLLIGFSFGAVALEDRAADLEARGLRAPGVVVALEPGWRSAGSVLVRFPVGGVERERSINLNDQSPELRPGEAITVLVDPADPERVAAPGVPNDPQWAVLLLAVALVGGAFLLIWGLGALLVAMLRR